MKPVCPNCKCRDIDATVWGISLPSSLGELVAGVFGAVEMKCRVCGHRWVEKEREGG
jgi:hypothetical protein